MRKTMLLFLALSAAAVAIGSAPKVEAEDCYWYCINGSAGCSCGNPRLCPWPPPPIACLQD